MTDYAVHHVATSRAGEAGYSANLPRGHGEVWHDNKRYVYDLRGIGGAKPFRAWVRRTWIDNHNGDPRKISGTYPSYHIG